MSKRIKIFGAVAAAVLAISLVSVVAVSADTETPLQRGMQMLGDRAGVDMRGNRPGGRMGGGMRGGRMGGAGVAEALGLTQEELRTALQEGATLADLAEEAGMTLEELHEAAQAYQQQARLDAIAERLEAGEITQEQADWLIEGIENDYQGNLKDVMPAKAAGNPQEDVAEALGLTPEELRLEIWGGATIEELFEEAGLDWEAFREEQQAEREQALRDAIQAAVDEGTISQDQADWLIEGLDNDWLGGQGAPAGARGMGGERPERPVDGERPERPVDSERPERPEGEDLGGGMRGNRQAPETTIETDEA